MYSLTGPPPPPLGPRVSYETHGNFNNTYKLGIVVIPIFQMRKTEAHRGWALTGVHTAEGVAGAGCKASLAPAYVLLTVG